MSEAERTTSAAPMIDEADVAAYLQRHPDFLRHHPDVLAVLNLRHDSGSASSLIERQVAMLRDSNRDLQSHLNEFMAAARSNEQRVVQLNSLAQALVSADTIDDLVSGLSDCVRREMRVDAVFIGLRPERDVASQVGNNIHILTDDDACDDAVTAVFRRSKPVCGALSDSQVQALFPDHEPAPASAAMVPLGFHGVHGALVLASTEPEHFVPEQGALFLELMGELLTTALRRYLGAESLP